MRILIVLAMLASNAGAVVCEKGCSEYQGLCACEEKANTAPSVQPSDEKPPKDKMPSYQREGVKVDMPGSLIYEDMVQDAKINEANIVGKKAAGIIK